MGPAAPASAMTRIYFAGPLFTHAELRWNREMAARITSAGHNVWLPQEKAGLAFEEGAPTPRALFDSAITGIEQADVVVAILDGADPDSGTAFECGYAHARGTPVIAVRTDFRLGGDDPNARVNLMLSQSAAAVVASTGHSGIDDDDALARDILDALDAVIDLPTDRKTRRMT